MSNFLLGEGCNASKIARRKNCQICYLSTGTNQPHVVIRRDLTWLLVFDNSLLAAVEFCIMENSVCCDDSADKHDEIDLLRKIGLLGKNTSTSGVQLLRLETSSESFIESAVLLMLSNLILFMPPPSFSSLSEYNLGE